MQPCHASVLSRHRQAAAEREVSLRHCMQSQICIKKTDDGQIHVDAVKNRSEAGLQDVNCCRMTKGRLRGDRDSDASERTNRATENRT